MKKERGKLNHFSQLWNDQRGAAIVFIGAAIVMLITAVGVAVDMGRMQLVRNKMHASLDAAAISAAAVADSQRNEIRNNAERYFNANYPRDYMRSRIKEIAVNVNADATVLDFYASANVDMTFLQVVGIRNLDASVHTQVVRTSEEKILELALVLDVTGSMNNNGKLGQLKQAVSIMTNLLYGNQDTHPNLTISMAPYAAVVNIASHPAWALPAPIPGIWQGCVRERSIPGGDREQPPGTGIAAFPTYYFDPPAFDEECPTSEVRPLTSSKGTVMTAVNALVAQGSTRINLGLQWGWRTLSPLWRGRWGIAANLPRDYNTPGVSKVVILMTDGDNTDTTLPSYDENDNADMLSTCQAMKAKGIIIYTIGFDITDAVGVNPVEIRQLLQACASQPDYYFEAPEGNELVNAFRTIAQALKNLRLSQ